MGVSGGGAEWMWDWAATRRSSKTWFLRVGPGQSQGKMCGSGRSWPGLGFGGRYVGRWWSVKKEEGEIRRRVESVEVKCEDAGRKACLRRERRLERWRRGRKIDV